MCSEEDNGAAAGMVSLAVGLVTDSGAYPDNLTTAALVSEPPVGGELLFSTTVVYVSSVTPVGVVPTHPTLELQITPATRGYYVISGLILGFCSAIGLTGNTLVLIVISHRWALQCVTQMLIANLATAHLLLSVFCVPLEATLLLNGGRWILGSVTCKIYTYLASVFSSAAILTLSAIAIDRYYSVVYPLEKKLSIVKGRLLIMYSWSHALLLSLPVLFVSKTWVASSGNMVCEQDWSSRPLAQAYLLIYMILTIGIPLALTCLAYFLVWRAFRASQARVNGQTSRRQRARYSPYVPYASKTEVRLLKMLFLMVACFIVLWGPHVVVVFTHYFRADAVISMYTVMSALWIRRIQPVVDPVIYGYLNKQFRKNLQAVVHACSVRFARDMDLEDDSLSMDMSPTPSSMRPRPPTASPQEDPTLQSSQKAANTSAEGKHEKQAWVPMQRCYHNNTYSIKVRRDTLSVNPTREELFADGGGVYTGPPASERPLPSKTEADGAQSMPEMKCPDASQQPPDPLRENHPDERTAPKKTYRKKRPRFLRRLAPSVAPTIEIEDTKSGELVLRVNLAENSSGCYGHTSRAVEVDIARDWRHESVRRYKDPNCKGCRLPPIGAPRSVDKLPPVSSNTLLTQKHLAETEAREARRRRYTRKKHQFLRNRVHQINSTHNSDGSPAEKSDL